MPPASAASALRQQIEGALARKIPSALTPRTRAVRTAIPSGIAAIDDLLEGGFPLGAISELTGPASAGRTTVAFALAASLTCAGEVCAWVDAHDGFDPQSAAACGVLLDRLLWVRCGTSAAPESPVAPTGTQYSVDLAAGRRWGCGSHPRHEERGIAEALGEVLQPATLWRTRGSTGAPGTPSAVNVPLGESDSQPRGRIEQVATDRLPARRGAVALNRKQTGGGLATTGLAHSADLLAAVAPRCAETQQGFERVRQTKVVAMPTPVSSSLNTVKPRSKHPWTTLDQAIRATDLLLASGGFASIIMDLSSVAPEFVNRIPLATWFRFRAAADRARTSLIVLTRHPCTQSSGEVLLRLAAGLPPAGTVLTHVPLTAELVRQRFNGTPTNVVSMRKPPRRETLAGWSAPAVWAVLQ